MSVEDAKKEKSTVDVVLEIGETILGVTALIGILVLR